MPNPFPGMDPYIECGNLWESFHADFISHMALVLNRQLPSGFVARSESRCYVVPTERGITPDVVAKRHGVPSPRGTVALKESPAQTGEPTGVVRIVREERREHFIEVRSPSIEGTVVTVIEVLSPANRAPSHAGRESYFCKQAEVLSSSTHLLEIDLLRGGAHTVAVPARTLSPWGPWNYIVCLHRADTPEEFSFYLNRLRDPLPWVRIPIGAGYEDLVFDLQAVIDFCYDGWRYGDSIDYRRELTPALPPDEADWADHRLQAAGIVPRFP